MEEIFRWVSELSGLQFISIKNKAILIKSTLEEYFKDSSCEIKNHQKSEIKNSVETSNISIEEVSKQIAIFTQSVDGYWWIEWKSEQILSDIDGIARTFDNSWFFEYSSLDRFHFSKRKWIALIKEHFDIEVKSYQMKPISNVHGLAVLISSLKSSNNKVKESNCETNIEKNIVHSTQAMDSKRPQSDTFDSETLAKDLRRLEKELMPQLEELGKKLPEIYGGYAHIVREITSQLLDICSFSDDISGKIALAAEIGARALESFGSYKAAKKHNQILSQFLAIKQGIANHNAAKIHRLLPESNRNLANLKRLFDSYIVKTCKFSDISQGNIMSLANIQLRVLNMYRTSLFLNLLAKYLDQEYSAWNRGKQTSGALMPDYYTANKSIIEALWGDNDKVFHAIETAADSTDSLQGKDIILLCDQQLFTYAIGDEICDISLEKAHPYVKGMISLHKGVENHISASKALREHIDNTATVTVWGLCIFSWFVIVCISIWFLPGTWIARTLIAIAGCIAIMKIGMTAEKKINKVYFPMGDTLIEEYIQNVGRQCGRVDDVEIDYEEKDAVCSALSTFFK